MAKTSLNMGAGLGLGRVPAGQAHMPFLIHYGDKKLGETDVCVQLKKTRRGAQAGQVWP